VGQLATCPCCSIPHQCLPPCLPFSALPLPPLHQLAVYAEFRQDWLTAVSCYQTAYAALRGVPLGSPLVRRGWPVAGCDAHSCVVSDATPSGIQQSRETGLKAQVFAVERDRWYAWQMVSASLCA
jgi:hypothetical protein